MISKRSVERYWSFWQKNQALPKDQRKVKPATKLKSHEESIIKWIEQRADITFPELAAFLENKQCLVSESTIWRFLHANGFSFKRRFSRPNRTT